LCSLVREAGNGVPGGSRTILSRHVAILGYRLYDIDRIINRTVVYGLLNALLGGITAAWSWSSASCPATSAAAHRPGSSPGHPDGGSAVPAGRRRRPQAAVDRRFDRRRYDMAKTVEAFSGRLRNHVDLDTLSAELLMVVDQTVQPAKASLWLRPPTLVRPRGQGQAS
jgi:hypothetical protein